MQTALYLANRQKKCMNNSFTSKPSPRYLAARVQTLSRHDIFLVSASMRGVAQKIAHTAQTPSVLLREMPSVAHGEVRN